LQGADDEKKDTRESADLRRDWALDLETLLATGRFRTANIAERMPFFNVLALLAHAVSWRYHC